MKIVLALANAAVLAMALSFNKAAAQTPTTAAPSPRPSPARTPVPSAHSAISNDDIEPSWSPSAESDSKHLESPSPNFESSGVRAGSPSAQESDWRRAQFDNDRRERFRDARRFEPTTPSVLSSSMERNFALASQSFNLIQQATFGQAVSSNEHSTAAATASWLNVPGGMAMETTSARTAVGFADDNQYRGFQGFQGNRGFQGDPSYQRFNGFQGNVGYNDFMYNYGYAPGW